MLGQVGDGAAVLVSVAGAGNRLRESVCEAGVDSAADMQGIRGSAQRGTATPCSSTLLGLSYCYLTMSVTLSQLSLRARTIQRSSFSLLLPFGSHRLPPRPEGCTQLP